MQGLGRLATGLLGAARRRSPRDVLEAASSQVIILRAECKCPADCNGHTTGGAAAPSTSNSLCREAACDLFRPFIFVRSI